MTSIASVSAAPQSVRIAAGGGSQLISAFGLCANVTNNKSLDQFVSVKSFNAWNSFLTSGVSGVIISYQPCSCLSRRRAGDSTSGIYSITPISGGTTYSVYCDMVEDGGGWALVGRSISGGTSSNFGWKNATGSPTDDANVYSANVRGMSLEFTETLLGTYTSGKNWGPNSFKRNFTSEDLITYSVTPRGGMSFTPVRGSITAEGMLYLMGYTNINDGFWTRDCDGGACGPGANWGLKPNGWNVLYGTPHFHGLQGMIFVR